MAAPTDSSNPTPVDHDELAKIIGWTAGRTCRETGLTPHIEDVQQTLWELVCTHKLDDYLSDRDDKHRQAKLRVALRNAARRWCLSELVERNCGVLDDLYFYTTAEIKALLPEMFDIPAPPVFAPSDDESSSRVQSDPSTSGDRLAGIVDVSRAVDELSDDEKAFLEAVYMRGLEWDDFGDEDAANAARQKHYRLIRKLQKFLGDSDPWRDNVVGGPGSRRSVSNSRARVLTGADYDE